MMPAFTTKNKMEREVSIKRDGEIYRMPVQLAVRRKPKEALFAPNGKAVRDYRGAWSIVTEGISNGRGGQVTVHDLPRSVIANMSNPRRRSTGWNALDCQRFQPIHFA